jgi:hypothetical protein
MITDDFIETLEAELRRAHPRVRVARRRRRVVAAGRGAVVAAALALMVLLVRGGDDTRERPAKPVRPAGFSLLSRAPTAADRALQRRIGAADPDRNLILAARRSAGVELASLRLAATVDGTSIVAATTRSGKRCMYAVGPGADGGGCRRIPASGTTAQTPIAFGGTVRAAGLVDDSVASVTAAGADGSRRTYPVADNAFAIPFTDGLVTWVQWQQPGGPVRVNLDTGTELPGQTVLRVSDTFTLTFRRAPALAAGEHLAVWLRAPGRPDRRLAELAPIAATGERSFARPPDANRHDSLLITADTRPDRIGRILVTSPLRGLVR